jgi:hypothetical protein
MEQQKNSRGSFLKAGLLVGGALYAEPAAALARSGGHLLNSDMEPNIFVFPKSTPISKFIPGSYLPDNTGQLTLAEFAGMADFNVSVLNKVSRKFPAVTLGDIGECVQYAINQFGLKQTLFGEVSGEPVMFGCCCCCCCKEVNFNKNGGGV